MSQPARESPSSSRPARSSVLTGLPPAVLFGGYGLVCLGPLISAVLQGLPMRGLFRELSAGLVMVGYVMMLLQFLLSGRFAWLSGRIGIDRTMRFHQLTGWAILAFIVLHPLLYAAPRLLPEPADALAVLNRMFASPNLRSGVIAWWLTILVVLMGVFRDRLPIRYEAWRLSHGLGAIAIALFGTHHTLAVGTYSADAWLAAFWIVATMAAIGSLLHVYVIKPLMQLRSPYRVVSNRKIADGIWEVAVEPERRPAPPFASGQFVWLNLGHSAFSLTEHPFSISSAPHALPRIEFAIKQSGDFTDRIGEIPVGTRAYLDGPHGTFTLAGRASEPVLFIAGGVGFAPVMGMLRQLRAERFAHPLRLIYANRVETQILYRDEIEVLRKALDFDVIHVLSEPPAGWSGPVGQLTPDVLGRCLDSLEDRPWLVFVCGPPAMMTSVERTLIARGIPRARIVSERFKYD